MNVPMTWDETPAGRLADRTAYPGDDYHARREAAEQERREARAEWEQKLASDPGWQADRQRQRDIAEHHRDRGQVITIERVIPRELEPLYAAAAVAQARTGTWGPQGPTNDTAREMDEHARQRMEAARLREAAANLRLPPGYPR